MHRSKLIWYETNGRAKAAFSIAHIERLSFEAESELPGAGPSQVPEEGRALALRHARLLGGNLANELERQ